MSKEANCCAVSRPQQTDITHDPQPTISQQTPSSKTGMVELDGGSFLMGSTNKTFPTDGEGPVRKVKVDRFWIDTTAVTNTEFAQFIDSTGYVTEAERFGWSFVFYAFLPEDVAAKLRGVSEAPWWRQVFQAYWRQPEGVGSSLEERGDHPVVHISWNDASAYANWCGKRLPTEAEWEYAARGGLAQKSFPWGNTLLPKGKHRCNIWQGKFPTRNTARDGHVGTCPVKTFPPNRYGLYNMTGNVWEWCADWFSPTFHQQDTRDNPKGPSVGQIKVIKGGSYLCHKSYCNRYRVGARSHNTPDSSTGHMGFRLVI